MTEGPGGRTGTSGRPLPHLGALALVAVALVAVNLRPGATSIGPVLAELEAGIGLTPTVAGVLSALPGLCFGALGALAVPLSRRCGVTGSILLGLVVVVAGLLLRVLTGSTVLFVALSGLALGGMAVGNVLVPAWIKRQPADRVRLMTVYGTGLTVGGASGAALAAPVAAVAGDGGWRPSLGLWGLTAVSALLVWLLVARRERGTAPAQDGGGSAGRLLRSPTAVALTAMFGVQSMNAYVQFGWLPEIYRDAGLSAPAAGLLTALLTGLGVVGGLVMPTVIDRSRTLAPWMVAFGGLAVLGYAGLLLSPASVPWLWSGLLGLSGWAFPTVIALINARSRHPQVTARLSGFVQPVGYLLGAAGPFLVGLIHAWTGDWRLVLVLLALSGVALTLTGLRVSRPVFVDDEMGPADPGGAPA
ncbi:Cyanate MFS transporter [Serinicoccus hydrothermalis]|uniref:Cyanate MFS transporter n=1 Tax=Serinicoccus hydrothermalis TaxID=1758689 RepID=A0A1B1NG46_9MICO|nr:MFS transporter [Serinicoccus hydrothermalis]ANS80373.1 Cyanate MFS transporter [Serinicoccus hydrothermalis]